MNRESRLFIWGLLKLVYGAIMAVGMILIIMDNRADWLVWIALIFNGYVCITGYLNITESFKS
jgi:fatty acid desaturase